MQTSDYVTLGFLAVALCLVLLGRKRGIQARVSAHASAFAAGRAEVHAELAAAASAVATGGSVSVHLGHSFGSLSERERAILSAYRAADNGSAYDDVAALDHDDHEPAALSAGSLRDSNGGGSDALRGHLVQTVPRRHKPTSSRDNGNLAPGGDSNGRSDAARSQVTEVDRGWS